MQAKPAQHQLIPQNHENLGEVPHNANLNPAGMAGFSSKCTQCGNGLSISPHYTYWVQEPEKVIEAFSKGEDTGYANFLRLEKDNAVLYSGSLPKDSRTIRLKDLSISSVARFAKDYSNKSLPNAATSNAILDKNSDELPRSDREKKLEPGGKIMFPTNKVWETQANHEEPNSLNTVGTQTKAGWFGHHYGEPDLGEASFALGPFEDREDAMERRLGITPGVGPDWDGVYYFGFHLLGGKVADYKPLESYCAIKYVKVHHSSINEPGNKREKGLVKVGALKVKT